MLIFNRPVQKEANFPGFHIHTVCNLPFGHSSELKIHLELNMFYLLLGRLKIELSQFNLPVKFQRILEGHNSFRMRMSRQIKGSKERAMLWVYHTLSASLARGN